MMIIALLFSSFIVTILGKTVPIAAQDSNIIEVPAVGVQEVAPLYAPAPLPVYLPEEHNVALPLIPAPLPVPEIPSPPCCTDEEVPYVPHVPHGHLNIGNSDFLVQRLSAITGAISPMTSMTTHDLGSGAVSTPIEVPTGVHQSNIISEIGGKLSTLTGSLFSGVQHHAGSAAVSANHYLSEQTDGLTKNAKKVGHIALKPVSLISGVGAATAGAGLGLAGHGLKKAGVKIGLVGAKIAATGLKAKGVGALMVGWGFKQIKAAAEEVKSALSKPIVVNVPKVVKVEKVVSVPKIVHVQKVITVPETVHVQKVITVPETVHVQKVVNVPQVSLVPTVVHVPKVVQTQVVIPGLIKAKPLQYTAKKLPFIK